MELKNKYFLQDARQDNCWVFFVIIDGNVSIEQSNVNLSGISEGENSLKVYRLEKKY